MTSTQTTSPHFCHSACYPQHATTRDLAADAASVCQDAEHFELYSDPFSTEAHIGAHELMITVVR